MELKLFTDLIDSLGTVVGGLMVIVNPLKAQRVLIVNAFAGDGTLLFTSLIHSTNPDAQRVKPLMPIDLLPRRPDHGTTTTYPGTGVLYAVVKRTQQEWPSPLTHERRKTCPKH